MENEEDCGRQPPSPSSQYPVEIENSELIFLETIGRGSYGSVQKARWKNQVVAVKVIDTEMEHKAFVIEFAQLSRVNHKNVITVFGRCQKSPIGLVMEYMENGSLYDVIHSDIRYTVGHAISWMSQCADGVEYLHGMKPNPIVHRDLKPPNLLLKDRCRQLKICDFGTACDLQTTMTNNRGSAAWMAPEVFEGSKYSEKCDVFSYGVCVWEVLARVKPFDWIGPPAFRVMWAIHTGQRPPPIDNCPPPLETLMTRCWNADANVRPPMDEITRLMGLFMLIFPGGDVPLEPHSSRSRRSSGSGLDGTMVDTQRTEIPKRLSSDGASDGPLGVAVNPPPQRRPPTRANISVTELGRDSLSTSVEHLTGDIASGGGGIMSKSAYGAIGDFASPTTAVAGMKRGHRRGGSYDTAMVADMGVTATGANGPYALPAAGQRISEGAVRRSGSGDGIEDIVDYLPMIPSDHGNEPQWPRQPSSHQPSNPADNVVFLMEIPEHLRPLPPITNNEESVALYTEHITLAETYLTTIRDLESKKEQKNQLIQTLYRMKQYNRLVEEKQRLLDAIQRHNPS